MQWPQCNAHFHTCLTTVLPCKLPGPGLRGQFMEYTMVA